MDVYAAVEPEFFGNSASGLAHHAGRMALVNHHEGIVFFRQITYLVHWSDIAVHAENAVGDDYAETLGLSEFKAFLQVFHICVGVAITHCLAEPYTIYYGGVVQRVGDYCIVRPEQGLENAAVGIEAGCIENRVLRVEKFADGFFQLLVNVALPADEADGTHSIAAAVHRFLCGLYQTGIVRKSKVVVGTEIQCLAAVCKSDFGSLGRADGTFAFVKAGFLNALELAAQIILKFAVHNVVCDYRITTKILNLLRFNRV